MKRVAVKTAYRKLLSDIFTPVGIYLRVRDRYRDTVLLESTDSHVAENSFSFICINAIGGMEIRDTRTVEFKLPGRNPEKATINKPADVPGMLWEFMHKMDVKTATEKPVKAAQGLFGYTCYDGVQFFDSIKLRSNRNEETSIPLMRYRLYQYVIAINHFKDELYLCENVLEGKEADLDAVESLIRSKDIPVFPFKVNGSIESACTDETYMNMVQKGIAACHRGDVFQIVLSRRFSQKFTGDEFNVYRALRSINPSPYLFFFDYGDYKLFGSSPESQLIIQNKKATVHPIAGTFPRSGDDELDQQMAEKLLKDVKENAEHVMLVDLARNDLSRKCTDVMVSQYRHVQYYSHVIHLVSEVTGKTNGEANPFELLAVSFPAGTLSGAPKFRAMELIDSFEPVSRGYYGGCIGFVGFDGSCNHAIMIRTFLSRDNTLFQQAGAGIVAASKPENELDEVNNKLNALKKAVDLAQIIGR